MPACSASWLRVSGCGREPSASSNPIALATDCTNRWSGLAILVAFTPDLGAGKLAAADFACGLLINGLIISHWNQVVLYGNTTCLIVRSRLRFGPGRDDLVREVHKGASYEWIPRASSGRGIAGRRCGSVDR